VLTIRQEQIAAFSEALLRDFEHRMILHLQRFFPSRVQSLGDLGIRQTIQYGIKKAAVYGIVSERDVCNYVELMMDWGNDFDKDPNLPWAMDILNHKYVRDPAGKIGRLFEKAAEERSGRT
jgi:hypothetical protein